MLQNQLKKTVLAGLIGMSFMSFAQAVESPNTFVETLAGKTLDAIKSSSAARSGDIVAINQIVNQYLMPHTNFEKTTRMATGQPWRTATAQQKADLTDAFKDTLVRTYSGAFKEVTKDTHIKLQPFRGDVNAKDVVVRSLIYTTGAPVSVDYRLEKAGESWKVYDFSVEGIWLIQNYKNQFAGEISKGGIDGLIKSLKK